MGQEDRGRDMRVREIQTAGQRAWQMQFCVFRDGRKKLTESGVRISYSSALTHRKRGLDFALEGLLALFNDSVRVGFGRCPGTLGATERAGPPFLSVLRV